MKTLKDLLLFIVRDEYGEIDLQETALVNTYYTDKYGVAVSQWPINEETEAWYSFWYKIVYRDFVGEGNYDVENTINTFAEFREDLRKG